SRRKLIEALVSFHEYQQSTPVCAVAFADDNGVVKRVERIVRKKNHSLNVGERLVLAVGVLVLCGAFVTMNRETPAPVRAVVRVVPAPAAPAPIKKFVRATHHVRNVIDTGKKENQSDSADVELIIRAHDHGVTTEYISELRKLGYSVNLNLAIKLVDHGVR